ncbi:helix-turn-helix domain-containing protein [Rhizobium sp. 18055]|jgi:transcriptional regulator with XRE-family HTH domain|uniref:helix-turn-helix domain-containing protein n=1 Tax=Rhizobium sp. 18055 TaxID=2681403 RepID=UPI00135991CA|nr:helix-turn-helix transcriptional regulator [Rhizobium sp. 18055]
MYIDSANTFHATDDTIGGRISLARDAVDLPIDDAARRLGITPDMWSAWENDRAEPFADSLEAIACTLEVSLAWLVSGHGRGPIWLAAANNNDVHTSS